MTRRLAVACCGLVLAAAVPARAVATETRCSFGGPANGAHVARLSLPRGSSFLDLRITGAPPLTLAGDSHLAQGIAVLDARTGALVASRVSLLGATPRSAVVRAGGHTVVSQEVTTPPAPFQHTAGAPVPYLRPGTYYVVAFGSDGDPRLPNPAWGAELRVSSRVACAPVGTTGLFDFDSSEFSGGSQVSLYGAGVMSGEQLALRTRQRYVFGLLDAHTQVAGSARLTYRGPAGAGSVADAIAPFAGRGGALSFEGDAHGLFPTLEVAGVAFTP